VSATFLLSRLRNLDACADDSVVYLFLRAAADVSDFASGHRVPLVLDLISDQSSCTFKARSNSQQRALLFAEIRSQHGLTQAVGGTDLPPNHSWPCCLAIATGIVVAAGYHYLQARSTGKTGQGSVALVPESADAVPGCRVEGPAQVSPSVSARPAAVSAAGVADSTHLMGADKPSPVVLAVSSASAKSQTSESCLQALKQLSAVSSAGSGSEGSTSHSHQTAAPTAATASLSVPTAPPSPAAVPKTEAPKTADDAAEAKAADTKAAGDAKAAADAETAAAPAKTVAVEATAAADGTAVLNSKNAADTKLPLDAEIEVAAAQLRRQQEERAQAEDLEAEEQLQEQREEETAVAGEVQQAQQEQDDATAQVSPWHLLLPSSSADCSACVLSLLCRPWSFRVHRDLPMRSPHCLPCFPSWATS
jgi:hypothetical protein